MSRPRITASPVTAAAGRRHGHPTSAASVVTAAAWIARGAQLPTSPLLTSRSVGAFSELSGLQSGRVIRASNSARKHRTGDLQRCRVSGDITSDGSSTRESEKSDMVNEQLLFFIFQMVSLLPPLLNPFFLTYNVLLELIDSRGKRPSASTVVAIIILKCWQS